VGDGTLTAVSSPITYIRSFPLFFGVFFFAAASSTVADSAVCSDGPLQAAPGAAVASRSRQLALAIVKMRMIVTPIA
jgi:hypothetical protein